MNKIKFSILQITYWCAFGSFSSFVAAYMISKGVSAGFLSLMLTANTLGGFMGQIIFNGICDKVGSHKKIFVLSTLGIILIEASMFLFDYVIYALIAYALLGLVQQPLVANLDTWILKTYDKKPQVYGPIRSTASIAFAVFMFFFGTFLQKNGYIFMLLFSSLFCAISIFTAIFTKDVLKPKKITHSKTNGLTFLHNKNYLFLLVILFGAGIANAPIMQFMIIIMKNLGVEVQYVGFASFANSLIQVPIMFFACKFSKIHPRNRIILGSVLYIICLVGISLVKSPQIVLIFCGINGFGFGLLLPALREYVYKIVSSEVITTAQGVCDAVYNCLGIMAGNIIGGLFIDTMGITFTLLCCAAILGVCLVVFIIKNQSIPTK